MRVFYEDLEEEINSRLFVSDKRRYYVKIDNVNVPEKLKGYKAIEASTINELKSKIIEIYNLNCNIFKIELWTSANNMGKRLDILNEIPKENEFIYVRFVEAK
jgi:hypothetical protein